MVLIITKNTALVSFIVLASLSLIFLSMAGITENHLLKPMELSMNMMAGVGLNINLFFIVLFIIIFPISYSILCLYSLSAKKPEPILILAPLITSTLIIFFLGISLSSLIISLGFMISAFMAHYYSYRDKELYKKISIYGITSRSTKRAIMLFNLTILLALYISVSSAEEDIQKSFESELTSALSNVTEMFLDDDMMGSLDDAQKAQNYVFIETVATSLIQSMEYGMSSLTFEEKQKCLTVLKANMDDIESNAKTRIDKQYGGTRNMDAMKDIGLPPSLLEKMTPLYIFFIIFSLWAFLEFLRILFFGPLSGTTAYLISRFTEIPPGDQPKKTVSAIIPPANPANSRGTPNAPVQRQNPAIQSTSPPSDPYYYQDEYDSQNNR